MRYFSLIQSHVSLSLHSITKLTQLFMKESILQMVLEDVRVNIAAGLNVLVANGELSRVICEGLHETLVEARIVQAMFSHVA